MNKKKETPLISAILTKQEELIKLILKIPLLNVNLHSQEPPSKNQDVNEGQEMQEDQKKTKNKKRLDENLLEIKKMGWSPLHLLVKLMQKIDLVEMICKKGANVNVTNYLGISPLHLAVQDGNLSIVSLLVRFSADVNSKAFHNLHNQNGWGDTPLHWAVALGHFEIVKYLINNDADLNLINNYGKTCLYLASERNEFPIVKYLIQNRHQNVKWRALNSMNAIEVCTSLKCYNYILKHLKYIND